MTTPSMDSAFLTLFALLSDRLPPVIIGTTTFPTAPLAKSLINNSWSPMVMAIDLWDALVEAEICMDALFIREDIDDEDSDTGGAEEVDGDEEEEGTTVFEGGYTMRPRTSWDAVVAALKRSRLRFVVRDWAAAFLLLLIIPLRAPILVACGGLEEADGLYDKLIERDGYPSPLCNDAASVELVVASILPVEVLNSPNTVRLAQIFTNGPLNISEFEPSNSLLTTSQVARLLSSFSLALELISTTPHTSSFRLITHLSPKMRSAILPTSQLHEITTRLTGSPVVFGTAQRPEQDELMVFIPDEHVVAVPDAAAKLHLAVYNILQSSGVGAKLDSLLAEEEAILYAGEALKPSPDEVDDVLLFYLDRKMTIAASRDSSSDDDDDSE